MRHPELVMKNNRAGSREGGKFKQKTKAKPVDFACHLRVESVNVLGGGAKSRL